ncbi:hypothetical protein [Altericroceibacterium endophyticum]|uniref:Lipoprotein n=1 Tax=Altericroceibacterium endophyticum TaxID=1808508 RepID=A0A6I4T4Z6_9SPHN|nr:hypothetical protein [Altericroceibacterium endophyticum]MXO65123.1 hypothetical protein [Altericroceibacterium endophyticum]
MKWITQSAWVLPLSVLAACSPQQSDNPAAQASATPEPASAAGLLIAPLGRGDLEQIEMPGELGCAFAPQTGQAALLVAKGFVDEESPASAVFKPNGKITLLKGGEEGGYDALINGSTFAGGDWSVTVERASDMAMSDNESPPYPALMSVSGINGEELSIDGVWTCGP